MQPVACVTAWTVIIRACLGLDGLLQLARGPSGGGGVAHQLPEETVRRWQGGGVHPAGQSQDSTATDQLDSRDEHAAEEQALRNVCGLCMSGQAPASCSACEPCGGKLIEQANDARSAPTCGSSARPRCCELRSQEAREGRGRAQSGSQATRAICVQLCFRQATVMPSTACTAGRSVPLPCVPRAFTLHLPRPTRLTCSGNVLRKGGTADLLAHLHDAQPRHLRVLAQRGVQVVHICLSASDRARAAARVNAGEKRGQASMKRPSRAGAREMNRHGVVCWKRSPPCRLAW